jgi:single-stranded DNA-specific DHH superfamily exonuclease
LIHHWDTDGICSAAIILKRFKETDIENWTPTLGAFYLTDDQIEWASNYNFVFVVDMALPEENLRSISKKTQVFHIDHHHQRPLDFLNHYNPVAKGESTENYPSNTWVIKELFNLDISLYVVLGFIGDRENKIKDDERFWRITQQFCSEQGLSFDELVELVRLIDSNYKVGDKTAVEEAPRLLQDNESPSYIKSMKKWNDNLQLFNTKMDEILSQPPEEIRGTLIKKLDTKFAVISAVTRNIAWNTNRNTIVINTGFFSDKDQLYSRSSTHDMHPLITSAKKQGFNSGGKTDVIGAIIPKDKTENFVEEILDYFSEK